MRRSLRTTEEGPVLVPGDEVPPGIEKITTKEKVEEHLPSSLFLAETGNRDRVH